MMLLCPFAAGAFVPNRGARVVLTSHHQCTECVRGQSQCAWRARHSPHPLCGNQVCEVGEVCTQPGCVTACVADCGPSATGVLPWPTGLSASGAMETCSGAGQCQPLSGLCACVAGRVGSACEACAASYVRVGGDGGIVCASAGHDNDMPGRAEGWE